MRIGFEHEPPTSEAGPGHDALRQRLLEQRIVLLSGDLDQEASNDLISQLLLLSSADPRAEIRLYINSSGGGAADFLAVYDTLEALSAPVATICMSQAKGTAALLLASGATEKRLAFRHAMILLKLPEEHLAGFDDVEAQVEEARRRKQSLIDIATRNTGRDRYEIASYLERGVLLTAEEAKEAGIIDDVIDPGHPYFARFPVPPPPGGNGN